MMNVRLCWETPRSRAANPITSLFWFNLGRRRRSSGAGLAVAQLPRVRSCPYHSWYPCRGDHRLDNAALTTVLTWGFVPGKRAGVPTAMWFTVPITFDIQ